MNFAAAGIPERADKRKMAGLFKARHFPYSRVG